MAIKFKKLADVVDSGKVKCLVYGFAGAGKTTLIATLPGRGVVISAEAGLLALRRLVEANEVRGEVTVAEVATIEDTREAYAFARDAAAKGELDWLAIDSVSEVAEAVLAAEKKATKDPRKAYGELRDVVDALLKSFRDLPLDVYLIAKAERVSINDGTSHVVQPMLPGAKLGQALPYLVDEVLFLASHKVEGEDVRLLQTVRGPTVDAKDRSGRLDPLEPADLGAILAKIRGTVQPTE
jgi:hypothetical protein